MHSSAALLGAFLGLAFVLGACGEEVRANGASDAGGSCSTAASGGHGGVGGVGVAAVTASGGVGGITASGGVGGSGGETTATGGGVAGVGGVSCEDFRDEAFAPVDYKIRIVNGRSAPLYVGGGASCLDDLYTIRRYGKPLRLSGGCATCDQVMKRGRDFCEGYCSVYRVEPGAVFEASWDGAIAENRTLPAACIAGSGEFGDWGCVRRVKAPLDGLTVRVTAWTDSNCPPGKDCSCPASSGGSCLLGGVNGKGCAATGEVEFSNGVATVTFDDN